MSYHEIQNVPSFRLNCRNINCVWEGWARTAGLAETVATEHIEFESTDGGMPNYDHIVQITPITLIGRNV
jgi:hypothetical protein